jgi:P27 family predicted phage terminase small subunit
MTRSAAVGRPGKHPNLKLLDGRSPGTDSGGREVPAPPPFQRGLPVKPESLSPDAAWLWDQVITQMETTGILKPLDAPSLEVACETFARWREAVRFRQERALLGHNSQGIVAAPWVGIEERASRDFRAWCSEFGFTPAAENNLSEGGTGAGGDANPFA